MYKDLRTIKFFKTSNFGFTWDSVATVKGMDDSYSIRFADINTGWCAGTFGKMYKTINGGYDWYEVNLVEFNSTYIRDLFFYNNDIGWAVGASTKILFTDNGGKTGFNSLGNENLDPVFNTLSNYPNPFNSQTIIEYQLNKNTNVKLLIYDITGRLIEILSSGFQFKGNYRIKWDSNHFASGIYFCEINAENFKNIKKLIITK